MLERPDRRSKAVIARRLPVGAMHAAMNHGDAALLLVGANLLVYDWLKMVRRLSRTCLSRGCSHIPASP